MSLHSSLRSRTGKSGAMRNVLKRHERLQHLISKGLWTDGRSPLGLPKIKQLKIKARKAAPKEAAPGAEGAAAVAPGAPASKTPAGKTPAAG